MDSIGGNPDPFTGKETICFNVSRWPNMCQLLWMSSPTWC